MEIEISNNQTQQELDKYTMITVIGKGGYAKVVLVKKNENDQIFALKILKKKLIQQKKQTEHIITERNVLVSIQHPFIVKLNNCFQNDRKLFFVLEFCNGGELFSLLQKKKKFTEEQTLFYSAQIFLAIEYLHNHNIIYRDLKPENVLIDSVGYIRITDFGLSKMKIYSDKEAFSICGTPEYLAPEILLKEGHGKPVDWWTFGCIIFEMITGIPPFYTNNRNELFQKIKNQSLQLPSEISPQLRDLLSNLFVKDPRKRIGSKGSMELRQHPWLSKLNWTALINKQIKPPFIPKVRDALDTSNFDKEFTEQPIESFTDQNSLQLDVQQRFDNFTYNDTNISK